jgi:putative aldouronate transport system substrate-binding protein
MQAAAFEVASVYWPVWARKEIGMAGKSVLSLLAALSMVAVSGWGAAVQEAAAGEDDSGPYTIRIFAVVWTEKSEITQGFLDRWEKENNVEIELELPPYTTYNEKLQIMLAGGDYPDVINFGSHTDVNLIRAAEDGVVIPITNYVNQTNSPNLLEYTYAETWNATRVVDGSDDYYMIPRSTLTRYDGFAVRTDWLANVGLPVPEEGTLSLAEFKEILDRFTNNDPDKNGNKDTYGFTSKTGAGGILNVIARNAFDLLGWQKYDNEEYPYMDLQYSRESDNFKRALTFTANLWKERLIDPDWALSDAIGDEATQKLARGEVGMTRAFAGQVFDFQSKTQENHPGARFTYIVGIENSKGEVIGGGDAHATGMWGGWALTENAKDPARIISAFDWVLSDAAWDDAKWGAEGLTYEYVDGVAVALPRFNEEAQTAYWWNGLFLRRNNDMSNFISLETSKEQRAQSIKWLGRAAEIFKFSRTGGYRPPISTDPRFIDAEDRLKQVITRIIVNDLPVDDYDKALAEWYGDGGLEYVEQMNAYLTSN